jgi:hypothetical protein
MSCSIRLWFAYGFFLNKISNLVELEGNVSLIVRGVQTVWLVQFSVWFLKTETKLNMWETELCKTEIFLFRFLFSIQTKLSILKHFILFDYFSKIKIERKGKEFGFCLFVWFSNCTKIETELPNQTISVYDRVFKN